MATCRCGEEIVNPNRADQKRCQSCIHQADLMRWRRHNALVQKRSADEGFMAYQEAKAHALQTKREALKAKYEAHLEKQGCVK